MHWWRVSLPNLKTISIPVCTLYKNPSYHDRYQFAAFEDDLCGVVEVPYWRVRQTHCSYSQQCQQTVHLQRNSESSIVTINSTKIEFLVRSFNQKSDSDRFHSVNSWFLSKANLLFNNGEMDPNGTVHVYPTQLNISKICFVMSRKFIHIHKNLKNV